jgi:hypothetical protein
MNRSRACALLVLLGILVSSPAAALEAGYLEIVVDHSGNATVTFEYTLSWAEQVLAFLGAIRPDRDLGKIFGAVSGGEVSEILAGGGSASFSVGGFAAVSGTSPNASYRTPVLNLSWAEAGWRVSFLSPLLSPDFSPAVTVIRFPDAYSVTFRDELMIPNITHTF